MRKFTIAAAAIAMGFIALKVLPHDPAVASADAAGTMIQIDPFTMSLTAANLPVVETEGI